MDGIRRDLLEGIAGSAWLVESGRAAVLDRWGEAEHAERARSRVHVLDGALARRGIRAPAECLPGHVDWLVSIVGATPTAEGPAVLGRYARWVDNAARPVLDDVDSFAGIARGAPRIAAPARGPLTVAPELALPPLPSDGERVVVLNDTHIGERGADEMLRAAVRDVNELRPRLVLVAGDITDDGEPEQFALAARILSGLDAPWHAVPGNHDAVRRSTGTGDGAVHFELAFGRPVRDVVVEVGELQVALVDSSDPTPWPLADLDVASGAVRAAVGGTPSGAYAAGQLDMLASRLDRSHPALLVQHHELQPFCAYPPYQFAVRARDAAALHDVLSGHQVLGVVAGHTHRSALTTAGPGLPVLEVPALKEWPATYTVLTVRGASATATLRQVSDRGLVQRRASRVTPVGHAYAVGPAAAFTHTFA